MLRDFLVLGYASVTYVMSDAFVSHCCFRRVPDRLSYVSTGPQLVVLLGEVVRLCWKKDITGG